MALLLLPSKPVGETLPITFPFLDLLAFGESITGATVAATVFAGTDASPDNILSGLPVTTATDVVQTVTGGVSGVIYELTCTVTTSNSNVLVKAGRLAVTVPGGLFGS